jgi:hypothetical protein
VKDKIINFHERTGRAICFLMCDIGASRILLLARDDDTGELMMYRLNKSPAQFRKKDGACSIDEMIEHYNNSDEWEIKNLECYLSKENKDLILG